jgi:hypothetical protein
MRSLMTRSRQPRAKVLLGVISGAAILYFATVVLCDVAASNSVLHRRTRDSRRAVRGDGGSNAASREVSTFVHLCGTIFLLLRLSMEPYEGGKKWQVMIYLLSSLSRTTR